MNRIDRERERERLSLAELCQVERSSSESQLVRGSILRVQCGT